MLCHTAYYQITLFSALRQRKRMNYDKVFSKNVKFLPIENVYISVRQKQKTRETKTAYGKPKPQA
jgi:hypothetical protein